jgi:hypothetical protein
MLVYRENGAFPHRSAPHTGRRCCGFSGCAQVTRRFPGCGRFGQALRLPRSSRRLLPACARLPRRVPDCVRLVGRLDARGAVLGTPGGCCSTPVGASTKALSMHAEFPKVLRLQRRRCPLWRPGCRVGILGGQRVVVGTSRWSGGCVTAPVTTRRTHRRLPKDRRLHLCLAPAPLGGPLVTVQAAEPAPLPLARRSPRGVMGNRWVLGHATRIAAGAGHPCLDAVLTSTTDAPGPEVARAEWSVRSRSGACRKGSSVEAMPDMLPRQHIRPRAIVQARWPGRPGDAPIPKDLHITEGETPSSAGRRVACRNELSPVGGRTRLG